MSLALALALQAAQALAGAAPTAPIEQVEIGPLHAESFVCSQHPEGQLPYAGDALASDCLVQGGLEGDSGFSRLYRTDGSSNEDWYGWGANVLAPFDGIVERVHVNAAVNRPGTLGQPPASMIIFTRADGVRVLYAHVADIRVAAGDRVTAGQVVAKVGNNGFARTPHVHVGAFRGAQPLQVRWDLKAMGRMGAE